MKLAKIDTNNAQKGSIDLPTQFSEPVRTDLILRAVIAIQKNRRQKYGALPGAGLRAQAKLSRRRRDYKTSYGIGISRVPRKILSHRGTRFNWVAAVAPGTTKGRRAHPPKASKNWEDRINKKENRKAIRSAIAATVSKDLVTKRGHHVPEIYPFIMDESIENITKAKDLEKVLLTLGFERELERSSQKKIRAGRGKNRGRPYKKRKGILIVVSQDCPLLISGKNLPGIDIVKVQQLNAELLAPGALPGRVTLWSERAIARLSQERLFA